LARREIRLQYSGLIIFAAKVLSIGTGLIFTLLITRNTTEQQYGIWANIFDVMGYFVLLATAIPFWTTRFVARDKEGSTKTGLAANLIIGVISTVLYLPLVPFITSALDILQGYVVLYFMVSAQIIEVHLINQFEATLRAEKPQAVGFGLLFEEITKISLAYVLIVGLKQPLVGAMISLTIGFLIQIIYYLKLTSPSLKQKIQWNYVREWLKGSTAYIYYLIGNQLYAFVVIFLFILGGQAARGDFEAASTISSIVGYSSLLSFALYPRLLADKGREDVTTSLKLVLMFVIPLAAVAMAIPDSLLIVLKESYAEASPVLFILAIDALITTITGFYQYVLFGIEKLDQKGTIPIRQLVKSDTFKAFTLTYVQSAIMLPLSYYVLKTFALGQTVRAGVYIASITMTTHLAMFIILYIIVRRAIKVIVPWASVGKYMFAGATMGLVLHLIPHPTRIALVLATGVVGGILYLAVLSMIDKDARRLIKSILQEIRGQFSARAT
jgi:O-antigen/teichoic acid export membrane protein